MISGWGSGVVESPYMSLSVPLCVSICLFRGGHIRTGKGTGPGALKGTFKL